jgi:UDP-N-acetylmuramoyl-tripeptide--D-alanyl-D-alanine ligase
VSLPQWQAALLALVAVGASVRQLAGWLYLFQLDEYLPSRLFSTARRRLLARWRWQLGLLAAGTALLVVTLLVPASWRPAALLLAALLPAAFYRPFAARGSLHWTRRAKRLAGTAAAVTYLILFGAFSLGGLGALASGLVDLLLGIGLCLAVTALRPYESAQRRHFMAAAEARLNRRHPLVVGITGSYGKTTTKVLLAQLLEEPGRPCFATPESFNTTLGVCRAINEGLRDEHWAAVIEMGAYRVGEIAEICSFTHPQAAILTAIGLMHLERFGSRRRIAEAKSELLAAIPADGLAVMPSDIAERDVLLSRLRGRLVEVGHPGDRWWLEGEEIDACGTRFRLRGSGGEDFAMAVPLYGSHLLRDLLCALAAAVELGHNPQALTARAAGLRGAPHRLEVTRSHGVTIIDDSYNSNPEGAAEALRLLGALPGERRVLVTPGFVELGSEQEQSMVDLGRRAAQVCSHVILVGPRHSAGVGRGLLEAGYPQRQLSVVEDLAGAQALLPQFAGAGSVVLFENDLPDQYRESQ